MSKRKVVNRFNHLTSKEWLPFQKSWFNYSNNNELYHSNLRFFTKATIENKYVYYFGDEESLFNALSEKEKLEIADNSENLQFALFDLRQRFNSVNKTEVESVISDTLSAAADVFNRLAPRKFLAIFLPNYIHGINEPLAWLIAQKLRRTFSLKDEKIACLDANGKVSYFYCLYFRKDENSEGLKPNLSFTLTEKKEELDHSIPAWYVLKPPPRKKDEILHPAKYPEELVKMCLRAFTDEGDNVFDPMSGTGSSQLAAMQMNRNGYGTELSPFFADIAYRRCKLLIEQPEIFERQNEYGDFKILNKDARDVSAEDFPQLDYIITSPPYWDMLNMKGAENQAKRIKKGLQTNYSNDMNDLGNIEDYNEFLDDLVGIYKNNIKLLKSGGHITIVVKNIKKKGRNYPFAWDLSQKLSKDLEMLPETFWCQDDIRIAPYGYGNTWVSNTFHHYCLHFRKP